MARGEIKLVFMTADIMQYSNTFMICNKDMFGIAMGQVDSDVDTSLDTSDYIVLKSHSSLDGRNIFNGDIMNTILDADNKADAIISDAGSYCLVDSGTLADVDQDMQCRQIEAFAISNNKSENGSTIIVQPDEAVELSTDNDITLSNQIEPDVKEAGSDFLYDSEITESSGIVSSKSALTESINQNKKVVTAEHKKMLLAPSSYIIVAVIVCLFGIYIMIVFPMLQGSSKHIVANKTSLKCENDTHNMDKPSDNGVASKLLLQKHLSELISNTKKYLECLRHEVSHDPLNKCSALLQGFTDTNYYNKTKYNLATQQWVAFMNNELSKLTEEVTGRKENNKKGTKNNSECSNSGFRTTGYAAKTLLTWMSGKSKNIINWHGLLGASSSPWS
ncbi:uncharacterized protein TRIADDRAFT_54754 [Trichoplax adhaerens]|uniref:Uncharacterized protein n=1 Tax=Trichoplax adhaerens TaxID=10228 RepID=B3RSW7_TRIAD|nr:predicted protein [Trichoplax adhaerens]EDV27119.1 predicted protein [Trichoplax adhaerens]|eukprot:XP_002111115.1 predicted protein [Trichoplax adhaerens]